MKKLALLLHHAGTAPDLIYPSLQTLTNIKIIAFYIKSKTNHTLNKIYEDIVGKDGIECQNEHDLSMQVKKYHDYETLDGVLTFAEMLVKVCNDLNKYIGRSAMSHQTIMALQDKQKQRQLLKQYHVPIPKFFEIKQIDDLQQASAYIGFPAIFKPNYGGGGYGIVQVNNIQQLHRAYQQAQNNYQNIILENVDSTFNLEELMIGQAWHHHMDLADYCSVESIVQDGQIHHIAVSDRTKLVAPFRESGYILPSSLPADKLAAVFAITTRALTALQVDNLVTHTEIKFTSQGPKIIEVNGRPGGTVPFRLKNATEGQYDLFVEMAKLSLGLPINTNIEFKKYAASKISHCPEGQWQIKKIDFNNIQQINSITLVIPIKQVGDQVSSYRGIEDLLGLYYLENTNIKALLKDMATVDKQLTVTYEAI